MKTRIGVDVGGTFTDFLVIDPDGTRQIHKTSSIPSDPARAVVKGLAEIAEDLRHRPLDVGGARHIRHQGNDLPARRARQLGRERRDVRGGEAVDGHVGARLREHLGDALTDAAPGAGAQRDRAVQPVLGNVHDLAPAYTTGGRARRG